MSTTLTVPALFGSQDLGAFYDATSDNFVPEKNILQHYPEEDTYKQWIEAEDNLTVVSISNLDTFEKKCVLLGIEGQLKLSIGLDMVIL
jgi:hypothetical protein